MIGLKENVILGKLIPAGTGMKRYRNVKIEAEKLDDDDDDFLTDLEISEKPEETVQNQAEEDETISLIDDNIDE